MTVRKVETASNVNRKRKHWTQWLTMTKFSLSYHTSTHSLQRLVTIQHSTDIIVYIILRLFSSSPR